MKKISDSDAKKLNKALEFLEKLNQNNPVIVILGNEAGNAVIATSHLSQDETAMLLQNIAESVWQDFSITATRH